MSRKPLSWRREDVSRPPGDQPWIWHQAELLRSPAWRARSLYCVRLIEFLLLEHMAHAGTENGNLAAPYDQLVRFGLGRRYIRPAIEEAEALRLIEVRRGGKRGLVEHAMNRYRLTFYATRVVPETGHPYWVAPGDEWRHVTAEQAADVERRQRGERQARKQKSSSPVVNSVSSPVVNSIGSPVVNSASGRRKESRGQG